MQTHSLKRGQVLALMAAHCAGMIDLVALPVWVGSLITLGNLTLQQAGLLVSLFLAAAVLASVLLAPALQRVPVRAVAGAGFSVAALTLLWISGLASPQPGQSLPLWSMGLGHAVAGLAVGAALSVTHGTIARTAHAHRLFAQVGMALGVFAVLFLAITPSWVARSGLPTLFMVFAAVMGVASLLCWLAFPQGNLPNTDATKAAPTRSRFDAAVWSGMAGISLMALVQAMVFSFLESVGSHRGFAAADILGVLIALGVVNLLPAGLAGWLERRLDPGWVTRCGAVLQAAIAMTLMSATRFEVWAVAASVFAAVMIFTHTFAFGLIAKLEPSGRALAATPAMLMTGAAAGPVLGGTLVQLLGYDALGLTALCMGLAALSCFHWAARPLASQEARA